ncbi:MAG TPA: hypothetical protein VLR49_08465 [Ferruginibacter sp.]|nr:hypothetical protein [Ferruginibacter sp.]
MKRLFIFAAVWLGVIICNDGLAQSKNSPYTATYSSSFKLGKPAYASKILDLWKDWDDNNLDRHDYFADTVMMFFPDGSMVKGKAANLEAAKKYRGGMSKVTSVIHAWLPLYSTDKMEDVVCVWGEEENTFPDGKVEKKSLHEVWWFNKDGKISMMRQWTAVPTAQ